MAAHRMQRANVRDIAGLDGPSLQLILKHACSKVSAQRICNILSASKALRSAVLEHGAGTAELTYTSAQSLEQVEAFAAWLATYGHLLRSLDFHKPTTPERVPRISFSEEERDAAEKAVASAFSKAASAVAQRGGLQLQTCKLTYAGPRIAELVEQLPSHSLTRLLIHIFEPASTVDWANAQPSTYIIGLSNSLQHLTSLRQLSMAYQSHAWDQRTVLDPLVQQLSALTNLTSLALSNVFRTDNLRHLPASLKELVFHIQFDTEAHSLNLAHLTALTRLEATEDTQIEGSFTLPPNLLELIVDDLCDVACVLPLQQLKILSLQNCDMEHPEAANLRQLSRLTKLESVDLQYSCEFPYIIDDAADAWQHLPMKSIRLMPLTGDISHNAITHLEQLTKLTGLTLQLIEDCRFGSTVNDFVKVLCKLTTLEQLCLDNCVHWQDDDIGTARASQLDPVYNALSHLPWLKDLWIKRMPISCKAAKQLAESLAGQLTSLTLSSNNLHDFDIYDLLLASPRLVKLSLAANPLTDGILPVIAATCTALESLDWSRGTEITNEGVELYLPHLYA